MRYTAVPSLLSAAGCLLLAAPGAHAHAGPAGGVALRSRHVGLKASWGSSSDLGSKSIKRDGSLIDTTSVSASPSKTKRSSRLKSKKKRSCKAKSSSSSSSTTSSDDDTSSASNSTSSGSSSTTLSSSFVSKNGIYWGYLPDEADAGGSKQTMAQINEWTGSKSAFYGYYAQAPCGKTFDGSQLMSAKADIIASGAIFQPAVMPTGGFDCFTSDSGSNAYAIANVMKEFTDAGVEVWLRFGHEMNWYLTDGTYKGSASGFISAWQAVAGAIKEVAPEVKMFWTPNIENDAAYAKYWPGENYVNIVGIDYYPSQTGTFISRMQSFHDTYAKGNIKFAIGETGWGKSADIATRLAYVEELTSDATKAALPNYIGCAWFNFYKGYDFRIVTGDDSVTKQTASFFSA